MKITFPSLLFVVFLVLKLTGYIAWSWWWVTAPLWIGVAVLSVILIAATFAGVIAMAVRK